MRVTRGGGLLENFLAHERVRQAKKLIGKESRSGRILDIGCGRFPLFLTETDFGEKYGVDKSKVKSQKSKVNGILLKRFDVESGPLPFKNNFFDVVTMLAVLEHIEAERLEKVLGEVFRVLKPKGRFVVTVPAFWTEGLLKAMARFGLISKIEIAEHKQVLKPTEIVNVLTGAGFSKNKIKWGFFELYANTWMVANK